MKKKLLIALAVVVLAATAVTIVMLVTRQRAIRIADARMRPLIERGWTREDTEFTFYLDYSNPCWHVSYRIPDKDTKLYEAGPFFMISLGGEVLWCVYGGGEEMVRKFLSAPPRPPDLPSLFGPAYAKFGMHLLNYDALKLALEGQEKEIPFLVGVLRKEVNEKEYEAVVRRQLALWCICYIGGPEATRVLKEYHGETEDPLVREALKFAVPPEKWGKERWGVPDPRTSTEEERVKLAVMRFGVESAERRRSFYEEDTGLAWSRRWGRWRIRRLWITPWWLPKIWFNIYITKDGRRALCSLGFHFGFLDGRGYDFVLRKIDDEWTVVGARDTWIS